MGIDWGILGVEASNQVLLQIGLWIGIAFFLCGGIFQVIQLIDRFRSAPTSPYAMREELDDLREEIEQLRIDGERRGHSIHERINLLLGEVRELKGRLHGGD